MSDTEVIPNQMSIEDLPNPKQITIEDLQQN